MKRDYDYTKGMKYLLHKSKECGIKIRNYPWVCDLSKLLSEHDACYRFWVNVYEQGNMNRISSCITPDDIIHGFNKALFIWADTPEGNDFWYLLLSRKLFSSFKNRNIRLEELRLYYEKE